MNLPTFNLFHYPLLFILLQLFLFCQFTEELDDCFFLTDEIVTREYHLSSFEGVRSSLNGNYVIKQGDTHKIEISGPPRYIDSLSTQVINKELNMDNRYPFCQEATSFEITITLPQLEKVFIDAESTVTLEDFYNQNDLNIKLTQKSILEIKRFDGLQNFHAFLSQEAQITTVEELKLLEQVEIIIEGKGYFLGYLMPSKKVNVNILGKGHCKVNTIEKLHVEIKGDADVFSKGNPILYKRITGKGDVYFID